jgi:hypothetical protein
MGCRGCSPVRPAPRLGTRARLPRRRLSMRGAASLSVATSAMPLGVFARARVTALSPSAPAPTCGPPPSPRWQAAPQRAACDPGAVGLHPQAGAGGGSGRDRTYMDEEVMKGQSRVCVRARLHVRVHVVASWAGRSWCVMNTSLHLLPQVALEMTLQPGWSWHHSQAQCHVQKCVAAVDDEQLRNLSTGVGMCVYMYMQFVSVFSEYQGEHHWSSCAGTSCK